MIFDWKDFDNMLSDIGRSCLVCGSENTEIDQRLFPIRSMNPDDSPGEPTGPS